MHREGVTIVKKVMFDENTDANEMMNSGQLGDLAANARSLFQQFNYLWSLILSSNNLPLLIYKRTIQRVYASYVHNENE